MEHLQLVSYLCAIFGALGTAVVFIFVRPLDQKLDRLESRVEKLSEELHTYREHYHKLQGEVRELRYAVQKAHDRLDALPKNDKSCGTSKN